MGCGNVSVPGSVNPPFVQFVEMTERLMTMSVSCKDIRVFLIFRFLSFMKESAVSFSALLLFLVGFEAYENFLFKTFCHVGTSKKLEE